MNPSISDLKRIAALNVDIRVLGRALEQNREEPSMTNAQRRAIEHRFLELVRERNSLGGDD